VLLVLCAGGVGIGIWDQMLTRSAAGREQQLLAEGEALVPASVGPQLSVVLVTNPTAGLRFRPARPHQPRPRLYGDGVEHQTVTAFDSQHDVGQHDDVREPWDQASSTAPAHSQTSR
jgi:hypothetical protein